MEEAGKTSSPDFLSGGGEMGKRIRSFDWRNTSLGDPQFWDNSLKTCVRIMLSSTQPIWIGWGKQLIKLYNDAYIDIVRGMHPWALGQPASAVWKAIWKDIEPMLAQAMETDKGTYSESQLLIMERSGYPEETYYTFSYTPVLGDDGKPAGIICYNVADTERIINERSLKTLQQLDILAQKKTEQEVYEEATTVLAANDRDFPFAVIFKIDEKDHVALPVAWAGIDPDHSNLPDKIDLQHPSSKSKNFVAAVTENKIVLSENKLEWDNLPKGAWDVPPHNVVHVPIKASNREFPLAILTIGLNPYRQFDDAYRNFIQSIADRISLRVNNVIAYEEERKRAEALEELDKAKTIFFSNISHEFRTPLTLILGTIEEVLNDAGTISRNHERMLATHRNAMRLLKLVNTLLDFSRIESGRQKAIYALTDIVTLTTNLASNFRSVIEKAGLKFIVKADENIQPVYLDKQMWEKIVFNLLSNAFKFTLDGSIALKIYAENDHAILEVKDTGVGIPEKELPHMFDRFHRVENVIGRTYEGTGIGLSLTKELVQLHGGTIDLKSKVGKGTAFNVRIPFGKDHLPSEQTTDTILELDDIISDVFVEEAISLLDAAQTEAVKEKSADEERATVLVVDDNADMREHIKSLLQKQFNVLTASNGAEALQKIKSGKFSLVLSDIMMPVMDGIQLLKEIKNNRDTAQLPVVLLTARAGEESRVEGFEIGADDYLVKPFSANELVSRIKAQIDLSQKRNEAETRLKEFIMQAPAAMAVLQGPDHVFTEANQLFKEVFARIDQQLIGLSVREAFPEVEGQGYFEMFDHVYHSGQQALARAAPVSIKKDGKTALGYYDYIVQPIKNKKGDVTELLAMAIDVTVQEEARRRMENFNAELEHKIRERTSQLNDKNTELENAQSFLQQLIDSSVEFISVLDTDLNYITVNKTFERSLGVTRGEVSGKSLFYVNPKARGTVQHESMLKALKGETVYLDKRRSIALPDVFIDTYFIPLVIQNKIEGVIIMARNVTEIVKTEIQLQEKNIELERINGELESFNYIASHDLQEPLRKIQTFILLLEKNQQDSTAWKKYTAKISEASRHMSQLIQSVLDYSRLSEATPFKRTNLNAVLENVKSDFELLIDEKKAIIKSDSLPTIMAIPLQMQQLFANLISNSLKFSKKDPAIRITSKMVGGDQIKSNREVDPNKEYAEIKFSDNGIGFEPEYSEQIFKLFQQLHTKSEYAGTGVGLSIAKKIVEQHKGFITAESERGKGATFTIWLPVE